jgi:hypothetical protein
MVRKVNRGAKLAGTARRDRALDRVVSEDRTFSDSERLDEFRKQLQKDVLPDLPKIPGYHVCWLTTNNPQDSVHKRMLIGYEPMRAEDHPGWEHVSLKTGANEGVIGINEMVAYKIPLHLWEEMMRHVHHDRPLEDEAAIRERVEQMKAEAAGLASSGNEGIEVELAEGMGDLGKSRKPPSFAKATGEA